MKKLFKWLEIFFNTVLVVPLVWFGISLYISTHGSHFNTDGLDSFSNVLLFVSLISSIVYIIVSAILLVINLARKKKNEAIDATIMLMKGIIRLVIIFLFFYFLITFGFGVITLAGLH